MIPRLDVILRKYSLTFDFVDKFTSKSKKHDQRVVKQSERAQQKITKRLIIHLEGSKKSIKRMEENVVVLGDSPHYLVLLQ